MMSFGLTMNGLGKPDAGNPHVRFDEGSESDGLWLCRSTRRLRPTLLAGRRGKLGALLASPIPPCDGDVRPLWRGSPPQDAPETQGSAGPVRLGTNSFARRCASASWSGVSWLSKSLVVMPPLAGPGWSLAIAAHL